MSALSSASAGAAARTIPTDHAIMAIPKKGRLAERVLRLLEGAGVEYTRPDRVDVAVCSNLAIVLVFLPASDIATFVGDGNVDIGITGLDHVQETGVDVDVLLPLGFGKCALSVQTPVASKVTDVRSLVGKRVATSFPRIAKEYFDKLDPSTPTQIRYVSGSVEASCGLGLADAVVDLVETGTTMRAAGLEQIETILTTQATLIANKNTTHGEIVQLLKTRIEGYITATQYMLITYNCPRAKLAEALQVTPGKRSPTVSPLEDESWLSVSALVNKKQAPETMDTLQSLGATDILLFNISNSRM